MRDAAGEPADRLHLLGLPELVLEAALLGDVLGEDEHRGPARELAASRGDRDVDQRPVLLSVAPDAGL